MDYELCRSLERYLDVLGESTLAPRTKGVYGRYATYFVRWLLDDYHPGSGVSGSNDMERLLEVARQKERK